MAALVQYMGRQCSRLLLVEASVFDDGDEAPGIEAGASDEGAVDIGLREKLAGVLTALTLPPYWDADALGGVLAEVVSENPCGSTGALPRPWAAEAVLSRADGPDGLGRRG